MWNHVSEYLNTIVAVAFIFLGSYFVRWFLGSYEIAEESSAIPIVTNETKLILNRILEDLRQCNNQPQEKKSPLAPISSFG